MVKAGENQDSSRVVLYFISVFFESTQTNDTALAKITIIHRARPFITVLATESGMYAKTDTKLSVQFNTYHNESENKCQGMFEMLG